MLIHLVNIIVSKETIINKKLSIRYCILIEKSSDVIYLHPHYIFYINNLLNSSINSGFEIDLGPTVLLKLNFIDFNFSIFSSIVLLLLNLIK
jgi:hypothetical protein